MVPIICEFFPFIEWIVRNRRLPMKSYNEPKWIPFANSFEWICCVKTFPISFKRRIKMNNNNNKIIYLVHLEAISFLTPFAMQFEFDGISFNLRLSYEMHHSSVHFLSSQIVQQYSFNENRSFTHLTCKPRSVSLKYRRNGNIIIISK